MNALKAADLIGAYHHASDEFGLAVLKHDRGSKTKQEMDQAYEVFLLRTTALMKALMGRKPTAEELDLACISRNFSEVPLPKIKLP